MKIQLNDKTFEVAEGITLAAFIEQAGYKPEGIAVAIQNTVVPKANWSTTVLVNDQKLLMIRAVSGG